MNRRDFLQTSLAGAAAAALSSLPHWADAAKAKPLGLQLYTLRAQLDKDLEGTLAQVAKAGYKNLESYMSGKGHWFGQKPTAFKGLMKRHGFCLVSSHVPLQATDPKIKTLVANADELFAAAQELNIRYLIVPYLDKSERTDIDAYKRVADQLNKAGEKAKAHKMNIAYHNHDFEFKELNGEIPLEVMLRETDPKLVNFELDLFWAVKAGQQPVDLFSRYPGRFHLWHVKDKSNDGRTVEVGNGTINFKEIFQAAQQSGMKHWFVEQDQSNNPLASIGESATYLKKKFSY